MTENITEDQVILTVTDEELKEFPNPKEDKEDKQNPINTLDNYQTASNIKEKRLGNQQTPHQKTKKFRNRNKTITPSQWRRLERRRVARETKQLISTQRIEYVSQITPQLESQFEEIVQNNSCEDLFPHIAAITGDSLIPTKPIGINDCTIPIGINVESTCLNQEIILQESINEYPHRSCIGDKSYIKYNNIQQIDWRNQRYSPFRERVDLLGQADYFL